MILVLEKRESIIQKIKSLATGVDVVATLDDFRQQVDKHHRTVICNEDSCFAVLNILRQMEFTIPVVVLGSEQTTDQDIVNFVKSGVSDFLRGDDLDRLPDVLAEQDQISAPNIATDKLTDMLMDTDRRFWALFDNPTDVIMFISPENGKIESVNPAVRYVLGYSPSELEGQSISVLFPAHSEISGAGFIKEIDDFGAIFITQEFVQADGSTLHMDLSATLRRWKDERIILANFRDVTDRLAVQQALHEMENQLSFVVNNAPMLLFILDSEGYFTLAEGRGMKLLGLEAGALVGTCIFSYKSIPGLLTNVQKALQGETAHTLQEVRGYMLDIYLRPIKSNEDETTHIIGIAQDVTEREKARQEMVEAEKLRIKVQQEQELLQYREGFISMLTHEFNNPLTTLLMSAGMLNDYMGKINPERQHHHLQKIMTELHYLQELTQDVMLVLKGRVGILEFNPEWIDLLSLTNRIIEKLNIRQTHHFIFENSDDISRFYGDPRLLNHILNNLLGNAQKYTPESKRITLSITIVEQLKIRVEDHGIGIPEEDRDKVFEPFQRAKNARELRGTGLGLALVKICTETHGGAIQFVSEENAGTTFFVGLPVDK